LSRTLRARDNAPVQRRRISAIRCNWLLATTK